VMGFPEMILESVGALEFLVTAMTDVGTGVLVVRFEMVPIPW